MEQITVRSEINVNGKKRAAPRRIGNSSLADKLMGQEKRNKEKKNRRTSGARESIETSARVEITVIESEALRARRWREISRRGRGRTRAY